MCIPGLLLFPDVATPHELIGGFGRRVQGGGPVDPNHGLASEFGDTTSGVRHRPAWR